MASQAPLPKRRDVNDGDSPMTPASASGVALASREREMLDLLARGLAYKEISHKLGVSRYTIMTIVQRIYRKLQVHSRSEAVAKHFVLFTP